MLVAGTNSKGEAVWVNPIFVRCIKRTKKGATEVFFHVDPTRTTERYLTLQEPAEQIASAVSEALPIIFGAVSGMTGDLAALVGLDAGSSDGAGGDGDGGDGGGD